MTWTKPVSVWLAPALVLALGAALMLSDGLGLQTFLSNRLFDAWQRHAPRAADTQTVKVLELTSFDEDSLVGALRGLAGAKLVVLTAPLAPGASPQSLIPKLPPNSDAARAALQKLPEPGHDLAGALRETKGVVPVLLGEKGRTPDI